MKLQEMVKSLEQNEYEHKRLKRAHNFQMEEIIRWEVPDKWKLKLSYRPPKIPPRPGHEQRSESGLDKMLEKITRYDDTRQSRAKNLIPMENVDASQSNKLKLALNRKIQDSLNQTAKFIQQNRIKNSKESQFSGKNEENKNEQDIDGINLMSRQSSQKQLGTIRQVNSMNKLKLNENLEEKKDLKLNDSQLEVNAIDKNQQIIDQEENKINEDNISQCIIPQSYASFPVSLQSILSGPSVITLSASGKIQLNRNYQQQQLNTYSSIINQQQEQKQEQKISQQVSSSVPTNVYRTSVDDRYKIVEESVEMIEKETQIVKDEQKQQNDDQSNEQNQKEQNEDQEEDDEYNQNEQLNSNQDDSLYNKENEYQGNQNNLDKEEKEKKNEQQPVEIIQVPQFKNKQNKRQLNNMNSNSDNNNNNNNNTNNINSSQLFSPVTYSYTYGSSVNLPHIHASILNSQISYTPLRVIRKGEEWKIEQNEKKKYQKLREMVEQKRREKVVINQNKIKRVDKERIINMKKREEQRNLRAQERIDIDTMIQQKMDEANQRYKVNNQQNEEDQNKDINDNQDEFLLLQKQKNDNQQFIAQNETDKERLLEEERLVKEIEEEQYQTNLNMKQNGKQPIIVNLDKYEQTDNNNQDENEEMDQNQDQKQNKEELGSQQSYEVEDDNGSDNDGEYDYEYSYGYYDEEGNWIDWDQSENEGINENKGLSERITKSERLNSELFIDNQIDKDQQQEKERQIGNENSLQSITKHQQQEIKDERRKSETNVQFSKKKKKKQKKKKTKGGSEDTYHQQKSFHLLPPLQLFLQHATGMKNTVSSRQQSDNEKQIQNQQQVDNEQDQQQEQKQQILSSLSQTQTSSQIQQQTQQQQQLQKSSSQLSEFFNFIKNPFSPSLYFSSPSLQSTNDSNVSSRVKQSSNRSQQQPSRQQSQFSLSPKSHLRYMSSSNISINNLQNDEMNNSTNSLIDANYMNNNQQQSQNILPNQSIQTLQTTLQPKRKFQFFEESEAKNVKQIFETPRSSQTSIIGRQGLKSSDYIQNIKRRIVIRKRLKEHEIQQIEKEQEREIEKLKEIEEMKKKIEMDRKWKQRPGNNNNNNNMKESQNQKEQQQLKERERIQEKEIDENNKQKMKENIFDDGQFDNNNQTLKNFEVKENKDNKDIDNNKDNQESHQFNPKLRQSKNQLVNQNKSERKKEDQFQGENEDYNFDVNYVFTTQSIDNEDKNNNYNIQGKNSLTKSARISNQLVQSRFVSLQESLAPSNIFPYNQIQNQDLNDLLALEEEDELKNDLIRREKELTQTVEAEKQQKQREERDKPWRQGMKRDEVQILQQRDKQESKLKERIREKQIEDIRRGGDEKYLETIMKDEIDQQILKEKLNEMKQGDDNWFRQKISNQNLLFGLNSRGSFSGLMTVNQKEAEKEKEEQVQQNNILNTPSKQSTLTQSQISNESKKLITSHLIPARSMTPEQISKQFTSPQQFIHEQIMYPLRAISPLLLERNQNQEKTQYIDYSKNKNNVKQNTFIRSVSATPSSSSSNHYKSLEQNNITSPKIKNIANSIHNLHLQQQQSQSLNITRPTSANEYLRHSITKHSKFHSLPTIIAVSMASIQQEKKKQENKKTHWNIQQERKQEKVKAQEKEKERSDKLLQLQQERLNMKQENTQNKFGEKQFPFIFNNLNKQKPKKKSNLMEKLLKQQNETLIQPEQSDSPKLTVINTRRYSQVALNSISRSVSKQNIELEKVIEIESQLEEMDNTFQKMQLFKHKSVSAIQSIPSDNSLTRSHKSISRPSSHISKSSSHISYNSSDSSARISHSQSFASPASSPEPFFSSPLSLNQPGQEQQNKIQGTDPQQFPPYKLQRQTRYITTTVPKPFKHASLPTISSIKNIGGGTGESTDNETPGIPELSDAFIIDDKKWRNQLRPLNQHMKPFSMQQIIKTGAEQECSMQFTSTYAYDRTVGVKRGLKSANTRQIQQQQQQPSSPQQKQKQEMINKSPIPESHKPKQKPMRAYKPGMNRPIKGLPMCEPNILLGQGVVKGLPPTIRNRIESSDWANLRQDKDLVHELNRRELQKRLAKQGQELIKSLTYAHNRTAPQIEENDQ